MIITSVLIQPLYTAPKEVTKIPYMYMLLNNPLFYIIII